MHLLSIFEYFRNFFPFLIGNIRLKFLFYFFEILKFLINFAGILFNMTHLSRKSTITTILFIGTISTFAQPALIKTFPDR